MFKLKVIVIALVFITPFVAQADGISSLKNFYENTHAFRANFYQLVTDKHGRKVQEVYGQMQLKRPDKFRWDYSKPYEQQIISDGKKVWLYDAELAQVTVNPLSKALGSSPAALLAGDEALEKDFTLVNAPALNHLEWVSAVPKEKDSGFDKILLGFSENKLQEMQLLDSFGHHTKIVFSKLESDPQIDAKTFTFKAPKGVDVIGE